MFRATQEDGSDHTHAWIMSENESNTSPTASNGRLNEPDVPPALCRCKSQVTSGSDANGSVPGCDVKVSRCSLGSANKGVFGLGC
jgi:hypothetical protein